jgi:hypothetical protein
MSSPPNNSPSLQLLNLLMSLFTPAKNKKLHSMDKLE